MATRVNLETVSSPGSMTAATVFAILLAVGSSTAGAEGGPGSRAPRPRLGNGVLRLGVQLSVGLGIQEARAADAVDVGPLRHLGLRAQIGSRWAADARLSVKTNAPAEPMDAASRFTVHVGVLRIAEFASERWRLGAGLGLEIGAFAIGRRFLSLSEDPNGNHQERSFTVAPTATTMVEYRFGKLTSLSLLLDYSAARVADRAVHFLTQRLVFALSL